jgi:putative PIN family toxin of toxin-antitoxin system
MMVAEMLSFHDGGSNLLDTNVFVSALLGPRGASRALLRACLLGRYQPLMGTTLFLEYEAVMAREPLFASCHLTNNEREALLDAFLSVCHWQKVYFAWRPNLSDEADNHLVELAVAGRATAIVTYNTQDFERAELYFPGLQIVRPAAFVREQ